MRWGRTSVLPQADFKKSNKPFKDRFLLTLKITALFGRLFV